MQVPPRRNPNELDTIHGPKAIKQRCSTKTDSGHSGSLTIRTDSGCKWTKDQIHWKGCLLIFPMSPRMPQLDALCDLGISFNVDNS
jgi:hypothetical protein